MSIDVFNGVAVIWSYRISVRYNWSSYLCWHRSLGIKHICFLHIYFVVCSFLDLATQSVEMATQSTTGD